MLKINLDSLAFVKNHPLVIAAFFTLISLWYLAFQNAIDSAISIWLISEIFNHCLLIVPIACFLIYRKKNEVLNQNLEPSYLSFAVLIALIFVQMFATAGEIMVLAHIAAFMYVPFAIVSIIGVKAASKILFPLFFFVFAIPVGEQFIPHLQEIAADTSVFFLEMTGVPVFRNGLYIEIPSGRFLVAEACSGISFTIVSVVFGNLYAYLNFNSLKKKLFFVLISTLVPLIANSIRVYGIILIAHLTDMEHAVGTDHLVYGWFFYCLVLFLIIGLGELLRDEPSKTDSPIAARQGQPEKLFPPFLINTIVLVSMSLWLHLIFPNSLDSEGKILTLKSIDNTSVSSGNWKPIFKKSSQEMHVNFETSELEVFIATFDNESDGELVSSLNRHFSPDEWSLVTSGPKSLGSGDLGYLAQLITSPAGEKRILAAWYELSNFQGYSAIEIKLRHTIQTLLESDKRGAVIIVSLPANEDGFEANVEKMDTELSKFLHCIRSTLVFE